jgi:broad-specificity NMP kinase
MNIKSKLINVSALARILNTRPTTLYNRINGLGSHKKLTENELTEIENLIKKDLKL